MTALEATVTEADRAATETAMLHTAKRIGAPTADLNLVLAILFAPIQSNSLGIDGDMNRHGKRSAA